MPYATDVGISITLAAAALGLLGGFSIPGRMVSGYISDRVSWQRIIALSFLGMAASVFLLIFLKATWMLYAFVLLYGICHGARATAQFGIIGQFFGMRSLASLIGIMMAVGHCVGAFAPYLVGYIYDTTGSYLIAFIMVIVVLLGASAAAGTMKKPSMTAK